MKLATAGSLELYCLQEVALSDRTREFLFTTVVNYTGRSFAEAQIADKMMTLGGL